MSDRPTPHIPGDGPFRLGGSAFWDDPYRNRREVVARLSRDSFSGIQIDAPPRIPVEATAWPLLIARGDAQREWARLGLEPHAVLCATVLGSDRCLVGPAFAWRPLMRRYPDRTPDDPGEGRAYMLRSTDLKSQLPGLRWGHDDLLVRVILGDRVSNTVRSGFSRPPWAFQDPEVLRFLEARRAQLHPPQVWPQPGEAGFSLGQTPPGRAGIELEVLSRVPSSGAAIAMTGFRLPLPLGRTVRPDHPEGGVGDAQATCVVSLSLVLVAEHAPGIPWSLTLTLPSHEPLGPEADDPAAERPLVGGRFRLDLFRTPLLHGRQAGRYHLYAFSGAEQAGPASFVVEESS